MRRFYIRIQGQTPIDVTHMGVFCLGRNGDIKVLSPNVSRFHCLIDVSSHPPLITDGDGIKESKNGTFVNNKLLRATSIVESERSCFLSHNDIIKIGNVTITFLVFDNDDDSDINSTK